MQRSTARPRFRIASGQSFRGLLTTMKRSVQRLLLSLSMLLLFGTGSAFADRPRPWQIGFQDPATPIADELQSFHTEILYIITIITIFVLGLLAYVCVRFRAK